MPGKDPSKPGLVSRTIDYLSASREVFPLTGPDTEIHCGRLVKDSPVMLCHRALKHLFFSSLRCVPSTATAATEIALRHYFNEVSPQLSTCHTSGVIKHRPLTSPRGTHHIALSPRCGDSCAHCSLNSPQPWLLPPFFTPYPPSGMSSFRSLPSQRLLLPLEPPLILS